MNYYALTLGLTLTLLAAPAFAEKEGPGCGQVKVPLGAPWTPFGFAVLSQEGAEQVILRRSVIENSYESSKAGKPALYEGVWRQVLSMRWNADTGVYRFSPEADDEDVRRGVIKIRGRNAARANPNGNYSTTPFGVGLDALHERVLTRALIWGEALGLHPSPDDRQYAAAWNEHGATLTSPMGEWDSPSIPLGATKITASASCRLVDESNMLCRMTIISSLEERELPNRVEYYGFARKN